MRPYPVLLSLVLAVLLALSASFLVAGPAPRVHADSTLFSTGLETGESQPTWTDTVDSSGGGSSNVTGICCGVSGSEMGVRSEFAHTGSNALMYSGNVSSTSSDPYAYMKVFDLSGQTITVNANTTLSYWIYPQSQNSNGNVRGDNSTCVALDMILSDGSTLRDSGAATENGVPLHPASQCGHLTLDTWNEVTSVIGGYVSGKTINRLNVGFDGGQSVGGYRGYIDDIQLANLDNPPIVPAQFIAKLYTEGLGRAPSQSEWSNAVNSFLTNGCSASTLGALGAQIYTSSEFTGDYSSNALRVFALYRGALNRDADNGGLTSYTNDLNAGTSWSSVVSDFFSSSEFNGLVPAICSISSPNYHFGSQTPPEPPTGGSGYIGDESGLQTALNNASAGSTVYLAQSAVIDISSGLTIPSGVTLTTTGQPGPTQYALMARLVRTSSFNGPVVNIDGGGELTSVWVDGQRNVLGYYKPGGSQNDNANIASLGGNGTIVSNDKLSDPQGGTNFYSAGKADGYACSNETVTGNLVTAYSANHGYSDNSDGLTMRCENIDIENNSIVDVTDIGIVLFSSNGVTQDSTIKNNVIISAGSSINGPIAADPITGGNAPGSTLDYSQTTYSDNTFWTGPYTTFDFGIVAGVREWFSPSIATNATGAVFSNNTTGSLSARVRAGIAVAGMLNTTISNDGSHPLNFVLTAFASGQPAANCPSANVIAEVAEGNASGTIPSPYYDSDFDNCL